jgi:hypothetical protein
MACIQNPCLSHHASSSSTSSSSSINPSEIFALLDGRFRFVGRLAGWASTGMLRGKKGKKGRMNIKSFFLSLS